eukprot:XP_792617.2 PREDICTED: uncharacterized protein LOC587816 [Strongylocentrotus purpuratus]
MGTPGTTKVVFLIDRKCGTHDENAFAAIRLAVLKLLTHFACKDGTVNEKMRWGYRIFDSTKECQMYKKRAIWLQYSYKHFKYFEEHLEENVPRQGGKTRSKTRTHHPGNSSRDGSSGRDAPRSLGLALEGVPDGDSAARASSSNNIADEDSEVEDTSSAYALRYALQDVMHDFQWEEPDMCSPMKSSSRARSARHRRKKRENSRLSASRRQSSAISSLISDGRQKHRRKEKMIFLAMQCPSSMQTLEELVGDATKLNSALSLRDTIISKEFLADFCGEQNGRLFWLNTNMVPPARPTHDLLSGMLSHTAGQVISLGWLMNSSSHVTSCLHSVQATQQAIEQKAASKTEKREVDIEKDADDQSEKKIPVPRNLLPLSIIIDYFLRSNVRSEPGMVDEISSTSKETFQAVLCSNKADTGSDHCMLRMMPMFTPKSNCAPESSAPGSAEKFVIHNTEESKTTKKKKTARNQSNNSTKQASTNHSTAFSIETGDPTPSQALATPATETPSPETRTVTIKAKIDRRRLDLSAFGSSSTFSCIGYDLLKGSEDDESSGVRSDGQLSRWFREAMLDLSHQRMSLIVELSSSNSSLTTLGVMEPLTPAMASIRLLHPKSIMPLATGLAFQPHPVSTGRIFDVKGRGGPAAMTEMKRFIERSAKAIVGSGKTSWHANRKMKRTEELSTLPETDPGILEELSHIERARHEPFHASWLEPWHISAPSRHTCDQVVEQLLSIPDDKKSPSLQSHHDAFYMQLKDIMGGEKGSTEVTSPLSESMPDDQSKSILKDGTGVRQSPRLKRMKSMPLNVGPRAANIMAISRKLLASRPKVVVKDKKGTTLTKKKSDPIPIKLPDVSSVEDLTKHLKQNYEDVLTRNSCSLRFTQSTIAVVLHFYKTSHQTKNQEDSISNMRALVEDTLLLTHKQVRERYAERSNDPSEREVRVHEVEMQTLLRMEMESVEPTDIAAVKEEEKKKKAEKEKDDDDDDEIDLPEALQDSVDEVVHLLETVPIVASADKLASFLTDIVLANYAETIPYMVRAIYEGLVKPVPLFLMSPSSDMTGVPSHKQPASYRSISSGGSLNTLGSNSNRSRALVRHPSIADAAPKRIIGVPARRLPNEKKKTNTGEKKHKKQEQDNTAKTVKRNLFNDDSPDASKFSRRRSVAVMETHAPRRSPRKAVQSGQLVLKTKVVKETPGKKQVIKAMLNKLDRARRRSSSKERGIPGPGSMLVIEESPEKPVNLTQPNVRRSPRVPTFKRRPSFYKKQEMHRAKLLGARIAGTSPPAVALKESPLSEKKAEKTKLKLSPATFLLSAITSPASKALAVNKSPARANFNSPSRNTRSRIGMTPVNLVVDSPERSAVRTTPHAKARRRLNDELFKNEPKKSPAKDLSAIPSTPSKTPSKAQLGVIPSRHRQSPRLLQKGGSGGKEIDRRGDASESHVDSMKGNVPVKTPTRRSPRKALRKIAFGKTEDAGQLKDRTSPDPKGKETKLFDDATEKASSKPNFENEEEVKEQASRTVKNDGKVRGEMDDVSVRQDGEPLQAAEEASIWFDKLAEDKEQDIDQENVIEHKKRNRSTPSKKDLSTPPIKRRRTRRDTCTPPYVPASKCTTPEVINSWPRIKIRYNSPSPSTSKVLSPCDISPIVKVDEIVANLTSPRTRRRTPQSSSKQTGRDFGKKRKRQSPGVSSSEKKQRRSTGRSKNSPRAKGSLLSMLTSKNNLEQGCVSPVFGKASHDTSTSEVPGNKALTRKISSSQKKPQPVRKSKSPGTKGSISSVESLDDLDRSFSPIFGKSVVTNPSASSQSDDGSINQQELPNTAKMSFIDQGLDSDADTDPEIDFPKLKSSEGSVGMLSDSEMAMMMDKDAELINEREEALSKRHLRRSSNENCSEDDSGHKKLRKRNSSHMPLGQEPVHQQHPSTHKRTMDKKQVSEEKLLDSSNVGKTLRKRRSSEKQESSCKQMQDVIDDKTIVVDPKQLLPNSILRAPDSKLLEDVENTRPEEPPKKKKRVTLKTRISSSLGQRQSTPSRLSMTLKRPSARENWTVTDSPEPASFIGGSEDYSLTASSLSSADDDVFDVAGPSTSEVASTPPTGKPSFVTTPLSATGLYSLMNSPLALGTPKSSRTSRTSRRNLPLQ